MRSTNPKTIEISVLRGRATLPYFLGLFQRHFEKSLPVTSAAKKASLVAPLDQIAMMQVPHPILSPIESISIIYEKSS